MPKNNPRNSKPVRVTYPDGTSKVFPSRLDAARELLTVLGLTTILPHFVVVITFMADTGTTVDGPLLGYRITNEPKAP